MRAPLAVPNQVDRAPVFQRAMAAILAALLFLSLPSAAAGERTRLVSVLVRSLNPFTASDAVARHHGHVDGEVPLVDSVTASVPESELPALSSEPGIAVVPNDRVHLQSDVVPRDATAVFPDVIGSTRLNNNGVDGRGVTVAVIDTGIAKVDDLAGRVIGGIDLSGDRKSVV